MPVVVRVLFSAVGQLAQILFGGGKGYNDTQIRQAINDTFLNVLHVCSVLAWGLEGLLQASVNSRGAAANSIGQVGGALAEHQIAMRHIVDTIIPASTRHAGGRIVAQNIKPLKDDLKRLVKAQNQLNTTVRATITDVNKLSNINNRYTVPLINFFDQAHKNAVQQWTDWFGSPGDFGTWAAPPLVGPLIAYWADPDHKLTKDALMLIVIRALQDAPNDVQTAFELWLTSDGG